jgi:hypothetical protein
LNPPDDLGFESARVSVRYESVGEEIVPALKYRGYAKVQALARAADECLEGRRHPTAGAHGTARPGQRLGAFPAGEAARKPVAADAALREVEVGES